METDSVVRSFLRGCGIAGALVALGWANSAAKCPEPVHVSCGETRQTEAAVSQPVAHTEVCENDDWLISSFNNHNYIEASEVILPVNLDYGGVIQKGEIKDWSLEGAWRASRHIGLLGSMGSLSSNYDKLVGNELVGYGSQSFSRFGAGVGLYFNSRAAKTQCNQQELAVKAMLHLAHLTAFEYYDGCQIPCQQKTGFGVSLEGDFSYAGANSVVVKLSGKTAAYVLNAPDAGEYGDTETRVMLNAGGELLTRGLELFFDFSNETVRLNDREVLNDGEGLFSTRSYSELGFRVFPFINFPLGVGLDARKVETDSTVLLGALRYRIPGGSYVDLMLSAQGHFKLDVCFGGGSR